MTRHWIAAVWWLGVIITLVSSEPNDVETVVEGQDALLQCVRVDNQTEPTNWTEDSKLISSGMQPCSNNSKYNNFRPQRSADGYGIDMNVTGAQYEDEGTYSCQTALPSQTQTTIQLIVEAQVISMTMEDNSGAKLPGEKLIVTIDTPFTLKCTAFGARPTVEIKWYIGVPGKKHKPLMETNKDTNENKEKPNTVDTISKLTLTPTRQDDGKHLTCETSGQEKATPEKAYVKLIVITQPEVNSNVSPSPPSTTEISTTEPEVTNSNVSPSPPSTTEISTIEPEVNSTVSQSPLEPLTLLGIVMIGISAVLFSLGIILVISVTVNRKRRERRIDQGIKPDHSSISMEPARQQTTNGCEDVRLSVISSDSLAPWDQPGPSSAPHGYISSCPGVEFSLDRVRVGRLPGTGSRVDLCDSLVEPGKWQRDSGDLKREEEFRKKLGIMQKLGSPPNVVGLIGYCIETSTNELLTSDVI